LYEKDLLGLEIRGLSRGLAKSIRGIVLDKNEICYVRELVNSNSVNFFALGGINIFKELSREIVSIGNEDLGYKISRVIKNYTDYDKKNFQIAGRTFPFSQTLVMGILNVTPDSFSDGGKYTDQKKAVKYAVSMIKEGADIIDVGGESTRPGSTSVTEEEELERVIPAIEGIRKSNADMLISIDTTKAKVAEEALKVGATIVNDISAFTFDEKMIDVAKKFNPAVVLMHIKGKPETMQLNPVYNDVVSDVYDFLIDRVKFLSNNGVKNLILDPGIGFGKRVRDNYEILKRLHEFKGIGLPILIGLSKKSFMGKSLNLKVDERDQSTLVAESIAIHNGARIIRTHNVKNAKTASRFIEKFHEDKNLMYD